MLRLRPVLMACPGGAIVSLARNGPIVDQPPLKSTRTGLEILQHYLAFDAVVPRMALRRKHDVQPTALDLSQLLCPCRTQWRGRGIALPESQAQMLLLFPHQDGFANDLRPSCHEAGGFPSPKGSRRAM